MTTQCEQRPNPAALPAPSDEEARAIADDINQQRPHWGTWSREFVAFALFPMRHRVTFTARCPGALTGRLDATEQRCRTQTRPGDQP
jgi:hypothetical protein